MKLHKITTATLAPDATVNATVHPYRVASHGVRIGEQTPPRLNPVLMNPTAVAWAALYFSLPLFWIGIQQISISIYEITFPLNLLAMLHGLSLTLPLVVTICVWNDLTWGRRFF